jgi:hypothetical protein
MSAMSSRGAVVWCLFKDSRQTQGWDAPTWSPCVISSNGDLSFSFQHVGAGTAAPSPAEAMAQRDLRCHTTHSQIHTHSHTHTHTHTHVTRQGKHTATSPCLALRNSCPFFGRKCSHGGHKQHHKPHHTHTHHPQLHRVCGSPFAPPYTLFSKSESQLIPDSWRSCVI